MPRGLRQYSENARSLYGKRLIQFPKASEKIPRASYQLTAALADPEGDNRSFSLATTRALKRHETAMQDRTSSELFPVGSAGGTDGRVPGGVVRRMSRGAFASVAGCILVVPRFSESRDPAGRKREMSLWSPSGATAHPRRPLVAYACR